MATSASKLGCHRSAAALCTVAVTAALAGPAPPPPRPPDPAQTRFLQVSPWAGEAAPFRRSPDRDVAVILLHGLLLHPFATANVSQATFQGWQRPGSKLVAALARRADVYAFAYSENVAVEEVAAEPALAANVRRLRDLGYREVVMMGHSAGGLIARQFVEDYPEAGVTKVIEVCAPNGGAALAHLEPGVPRAQRVFLHSLSKESRAHFLAGRPNKLIPPTVQFVCVVGDGAGLGDYILSNEAQWPRDLQAQGIPALPLRTTHFTVMRTQAAVERLAELVARPVPRWNPAQVAVVRKELAGVGPRH